MAVVFSFSPFWADYDEHHTVFDRKMRFSGRSDQYWAADGCPIRAAISLARPTIDREPMYVPRGALARGSWIGSPTPGPASRPTDGRTLPQRCAAVARSFR